MAAYTADSIKEALGWLAQSLQTAQAVLVLLAFFAVVCASGAIIGVSYAAYRRIGRLEMLQ